MASFSYHDHPFLYDPVFLQNPHLKMFGFLDDLDNPTSSPFSEPYYPPESLHHFSVDHASVHDSSCLENGGISNADVSNNNEPSVTKKHGQCADSSSVVDYRTESRSTGGEQVTDQKAVKATLMDNKWKRRDGSSSSMTTAQSKGAREVKGRMRKQKESIGVREVDDEEKNKKKKTNKDDHKKVPNEHEGDAPTGFIHVRARRGQATDSHSLAERVRREKISERMKVLQALVPGCDKVTGKALMLDEIINYVQSLQNQVEFLSMKLASVNPMFYDFGMDLDAFMVSPAQMRLNGLETSPLPNVHTCNPAQGTNVSDITTTTTTFPTPNSYPLLDSPTSSSLIFQQGQRLINILSQDNGQLLWDVDHQRQKLINQSDFSNNLCSFH